MFIHLGESEGTACEHHDEADQGRQRQGFQVNLHGNGRRDRGERDGVLFRKGLRSRVGIGTDDGAVVIVAGTAVENENRKGKPRKHRKPRDPGDVRDVRDRRRKAVRGEAVRYDTLENKAEPDGERNVGGREPEPQRAGRGTAIELHCVHEFQQRRNQQRNKGDVNRYDVLRQAGNEGEHKAELHGALTHARREPVHQHLHEAGIGNRDCEGAQENVGECRRGVRGKARGEKIHGLCEPHAACDAGRDGRQ